jgi:hypothetical protein
LKHIHQAGNHPACKMGFWEALRKRDKDLRRLVDTGVSVAEQVQVEAYFDALQLAVDGLGEVGWRGLGVWISGLLFFGPEG